MPDLNTYLRSFSRNKALFFLFTFALFYLVQDATAPLLETLIIDPVLSNIPQTHISNFIFTAFLGLAILRFSKGICNRLYPTLNWVWFIILTTLFYIFFIRTREEYLFHNYASWKLPGVFYFDILLLSGALYMIRLRSFEKSLRKEESSFTLIEDYADPTKIEDKYGSTGYASNIASYISRTTCDTSFVIGIFAEWGAGKTDFLLRLKRALTDPEGEKSAEQGDELRTILNNFTDFKDAG